MCSRTIWLGNPELPVSLGHLIAPGMLVAGTPNTPTYPACALVPGQDDSLSSIAVIKPAALIAASKL